MCGAVCGGLGCTALWHSAAFKKKSIGYLPSQEIISLEKRLSLFLGAGYWGGKRQQQQKSTWSDLFFK